MDSAINLIRQHDPLLVDTLGALVNQYRFDILQEVFGNLGNTCLKKPDS
jgi:hypothetical protein